MKSLVETLQDEMLAKQEEISFSTQRDVDFAEVEDKISVAIGMRRTGKTHLMLKKIQRLLSEGIPSSRILYVDFEDDRLLPLSQKTLASMLDSFYSCYPENHDLTCYFFLDEIQNIESWALVIRRFYNTKKVKIYLSGSSAKLLSKEIATSLRGRSIATEVWPLSFHEFLRVKQAALPKRLEAKKSQDYLQKWMLDYLEIGGFPGVIQLSKSSRIKVLQEYVDVVIYRDIIERYEVTHVNLIKYMIIYLINNAATNFSVNKFYNDIKSQGYAVSKQTVSEYMTYIEDTYLAFTVSLYSESIRKVQTNPKKIYLIDSGIYHALTMQLNDSLGRLFENLIYLDLRRRGDKIYYYLTKSRYEVDFFTRSLDGKLHLYQVVLDSSDQKTFERESRALTEAENELGVKGVIVTLENYPLMSELFQPL